MQLLHVYRPPAAAYSGCCGNRFCSIISDARGDGAKRHKKVGQVPAKRVGLQPNPIINQRRPRDVFKIFLHHKDGFTRIFDFHGCNVEGILMLYEASYLGFEGEDVLSMAQLHAFKHLENHLKSGKIDTKFEKRVRHVLQLPSHWRMSRLQARWMINFNDMTTNVNPLILQFAKLDFNLLQALHKRELGEITKWWNNLCIVDELTFARDRVVESYVWTVGLVFEPINGDARKYLTQAISLLYVIDDMYDVHGSIEELEMFTEVVVRWDTNAIEKLPMYMRICFLALFNIVNQSTYHILREKKVFIMQYIKKMWEDLCKAYLLEAKWYHNKQIPLLEEYMGNATKSSGVHLALSYVYIFTSQHISNEGLEYLQKSPNLLDWSGNVFRLNNDLYTSSKELERGDVPKAVECCMHEKSISRLAAKKNIESIIVNTRRRINQERFVTPIPKNIFDGCINICRASHCFYRKGDGYGSPAKEQVKSLLFDSV